MTKDELLALLQKPEDQQLEFKPRLTGSGANVAKSLASFANAEGGTLVLGFDERRHRPIELADPDAAPAPALRGPRSSSR